ncbi:hypothetical protein PROFUN_10099 [Planoprotostelium fungivorum]|uniref:Uncharacterized protein n=1 Tax=Planoprotostelium fungivorum TaxID=1890364 RepID=A0A2P6NF01_9EUKA|nr:hypothetical protein PROFUN_10099 [Planoprotostelium fungivorum]
MSLHCCSRGSCWKRGLMSAAGSRRYSLSSSSRDFDRLRTITKYLTSNGTLADASGPWRESVEQFRFHGDMNMIVAPTGLLHSECTSRMSRWCLQQNLRSPLVRTIYTCNCCCKPTSTSPNGTHLSHQPHIRLPMEPLDIVEKHFHNLISKRAKEFDIKAAFDYPKLHSTPLDVNQWLAVPGMYGGFAWTLSMKDEKQPIIKADSWCRVCGGSEQSHTITVEGTREDE